MSKTSAVYCTTIPDWKKKNKMFNTNHTKLIWTQQQSMFLVSWCIIWMSHTSHHNTASTPGSCSLRQECLSVSLAPDTPAILQGPAGFCELYWPPEESLTFIIITGSFLKQLFANILHTIHSWADFPWSRSLEAGACPTHQQVWDTLMLSINHTKYILYSPLLKFSPFL